ncbi:MAG: carboxypeptidase-like regulatory domain-containing protein [Cyclobacteriaceae bacterium]
MKFSISWLLLAFCITSQAQSIIGTVRDAVSLAPLVGATISIVSSDKGAVSDVNGSFEITELASGKYTLQAQYIGYAPLQVADIWVRGSKTITQDILLQPTAESLSEVQVTANRSTFEPGSIGITEEQIYRYAATYFDPARIVINSPDVAVANDQNNQVSVRGLPPSLNVWRLEGVEIVNPNHLSNAGTFLDQPTPTGGGVNALSAQMLDRSLFRYSSMNSQIGNATTGMFDMEIKSGNANRQHIAQASLIGFDLFTEGAFSKKSRATYALNYRYSFTGLLAKFGVDFGGETIGFQDLALSINIPIKHKQSLKIYAIGGLSSNDFESPDVPEKQKDLSDIYFDSKLGVVGMTYTKGYANSNFNASASYSWVVNQRDEFVFADIQSGQPSSEDFLFTDKHSILSSQLTYETRLTERITSAAGVMANYYHYDQATVSPVSVGIVRKLDQFLVRPYLDFKGTIGKAWSWNAGLGVALSGKEKSQEPRGSLTYQLNRQNTLSVGLGRYSQLLRPYNHYFDRTVGVDFDAGSDFIQSNRYTLSHSLLSEHFTLNTELFAYYFPEVNTIDGKESAQTIGFSSAVHRELSNGLYFDIGGSLFQSTIGSRSSSFDNSYTGKATFGQEWTRKKKPNKTFGINLRGLVQGGIPLELTQATSQFVVTSEYETTPYYRLDLRLLWTKEKKGRTSSWSLDLQNMTNHENEAWRYYDQFTQQIETQYQLGLIPILTYRVEW